MKKMLIEVTDYGEGFLARVPGTLHRGVGTTIPMALRRLGDSLVVLKCAGSGMTYMEVLARVDQQQVYLGTLEAING